MSKNDINTYFQYFEKANVTGLLLRVGLAFVFLYASIAQFRSPLDWVGYIPPALTMHVDAMSILRLNELFEFILAFWLLSGIYIRAAAFVAALALAGIVVTNMTQLIVTFRDVGLVFAALALAFMPNNSHLAQSHPDRRKD